MTEEGLEPVGADLDVSIDEATRGVPTQDKSGVAGRRRPSRPGPPHAVRRGPTAGGATGVVDDDHRDSPPRAGRPGRVGSEDGHHDGDVPGDEGGRTRHGVHDAGVEQAVMSRCGPAPAGGGRPRGGRRGRPGRAGESRNSVSGDPPTAPCRCRPAAPNRRARSTIPCGRSRRRGLAGRPWHKQSRYAHVLCQRWSWLPDPHDGAAGPKWATTAETRSQGVEQPPPRRHRPPPDRPAPPWPSPRPRHRRAGRASARPAAPVAGRGDPGRPKRGPSRSSEVSVPGMGITAGDDGPPPRQHGATLGAAAAHSRRRRRAPVAVPSHTTATGRRCVQLDEHRLQRGGAEGQGAGNPACSPLAPYGRAGATTTSSCGRRPTRRRRDHAGSVPGQVETVLLAAPEGTASTLRAGQRSGQVLGQGREGRTGPEAGGAGRRTT